MVVVTAIMKPDEKNEFLDGVLWIATGYQESTMK